MDKQSEQSAESPIKFSIFDIRVIGIIAQIIFVILTLLFFAWIARNTAANINTLGENQFACGDGTSSFRCAFNFMDQSAQFDISESPIISYSPQDTYWRAAGVAALNTLRVTSWGILFTTILGTFVGISLLSKNWFVRTVSRVYVELFRNTPLLVQLAFIGSVFFAVFLPPLRDAKPLFGLPIYLNARGLNIPAVQFMPNGELLQTLLWIGAIAGLILWFVLSRYTLRTGKDVKGWLFGLGTFAVCAALGWFLSGTAPSTQGFVTQDGIDVSSFDDVVEMVVDRSPVPLSEWSTADLTDEQIEATQLTVCSVADELSTDNFVEQLEAADIPYDITRAGRLSKAVSDFEDGDCELFVADQSVLEEEVEGASIVTLDEPRVILSIPRLDGLNFQGGRQLTAAFGAVLLGLVLNTGANVAEIIRAGIQSVSKGQTEAAYALGLSNGQRLRLVVLPQALQVIIPPLISQYLNLAKNSTLALIVAYPDWWSVINTIINQSGRPIQPIVLTMAAFLTLSLSISAFLNWYNGQIRLKER